MLFSWGWLGKHLLEPCVGLSWGVNFLLLNLQHTMLQLIKEAGCYNGITSREDFPVTEVLNQVCPSTWRGACKTAVQLLFGQAGLVSACARCRSKERLPAREGAMARVWKYWAFHQGHQCCRMSSTETTVKERPYKISFCFYKLVVYMCREPSCRIMLKTFLVLRNHCISNSWTGPGDAFFSRLPNFSLSWSFAPDPPVTWKYQFPRGTLIS